MIRLATIAIATALLGGAGAGPSHQESALGPAFGNIIVSTHPDGRQARLMLAADHTFSARGRAGNRSSGTWRVRGGRLCLTQRHPLPIPFSYCHAFPSISVGAQWNDTASNGDRVINEVVQGRS